MKHSIYCIKDTKVGQCNPPVLFANDATATRAFGDLVTKDKESVIGQHSEDFILLRVGTFNLETGVIEQLVTPVCVCSGVDFVK